MRISIPFTYQVNAVPYKHKQSTNLTMLENVWVEIPEVAAEWLELALTIRDTNGNALERVYAYGGEFWVKDSRCDDDLPFLKQHLSAAGQRVPEQRVTQLGRRDQDEAEEATKLLGFVGMLRTKTAGLDRYEANKSMLRGENGPEFLERTVETERARSLRDSTREDRLHRALRIAQKHTITVDGDLYHRVAEPTVYCKSSIVAEWRFGCHDYMTEPGISKSNDYPLSAKDFDRINELFDRDTYAVRVGFAFEVLDGRHFKVKAERIALVSAAQRIVTDGLYSGNSTPYIHTWCRLRDQLNFMWQGEDGSRLTGDQLLSKDIGEFEALAGLIEGLAAFGEPRRYGGDLDLQGLRMWDARTVSVQLSSTGPKP
jgi:hypothetical protein